MPSKLLTISPGPMRECDLFIICGMYYFNLSYSCVSINIYGYLRPTTCPNTTCPNNFKLRTCDLPK